VHSGTWSTLPCCIQLCLYAHSRQSRQHIMCLQMAVVAGNQVVVT
jgi:hypothetical protein